MPHEPIESKADYLDMIRLLESHEARYLIVGGVAFTYHAKPRSTKDLDIWVEPSGANIERVNRALAEFGSPHVFDPGVKGQILQIGVRPTRVDLLLSIEGVRFETAWRHRVRDRFGDVETNWLDMNSLIRNKRCLDGPRHREDLRVLQQVKRMRAERQER